MIDRKAETTPTWPEWLKSQLAAHRVSAEELAIVLGTEPLVVAEWLAGQTKPTSADLDSLAAVLGLDRAMLDQRVGVQSPRPVPSHRYDPFREVLKRVEAAAADL